MTDKVEISESHEFKKELAEVYRSELIKAKSAEVMPSFILSNILLIVEMCKVVGMGEKEAFAFLEDLLMKSVAYEYTDEE